MNRLIRITLALTALFASACSFEEQNEEARQASAAQDAWSRLHNEVGFDEAALVVVYAQVFDGYRSERAGEGVLLAEAVSEREDWLPRTLGLTVQRNEPWSTAAVGEILIVACRSPWVDNPEYGTRCWIRGFTDPDRDPAVFNNGRPVMLLSERGRRNMSGYTADNPWPLWVGTTEAERREAWANALRD